MDRDFLMGIPWRVWIMQEIKQQYEEYAASRAPDPAPVFSQKRPVKRPPVDASQLFEVRPNAPDGKRGK